MGIFRRLFLKKQQYVSADDLLDSLEEIEGLEEQGESEKLEDVYQVVSLYNNVQRSAYVLDCLERMKEATIEVEQLSAEYTDVSVHLTDIEELDRLPQSERNLVEDLAQKIVSINEERVVGAGKRILLTKKQLFAMEQIEDLMPEPYKKLKECEEYQEKVRSDLKRLDAERDAYEYRKEELDNSLYNIRGMSIVAMISFVICIFLLFILQVTLEIDVSIGYTISILAVAGTVTWLCIRHADDKKEKKRVLGAFNQIILLQNKVKIRYVNNTNLLEYLRVKYGCETSSIMNTLWKRYQEELMLQERFERTKEELSYQNQKLVRLLSQYHLADTRIWVSQVGALIDPREMVEIRHRYNVSRQKLRKQIQYNQEIIEEKKSNIKEVIEKYPESAQEILEIVDSFE